MNHKKKKNFNKNLEKILINLNQKNSIVHLEIYQSKDSIKNLK